MKQYIIRRILISIVVLFGVSFLIYGILRLIYYHSSNSTFRAFLTKIEEIMEVLWFSKIEED